MMRPIGHFLAEFRPEGAPPHPAALPAFDLSEPSIAEDVGFPEPQPGSGEAFDALPDPEAAPPLALLEAPAEPTPDHEAILAEREAAHAEALEAALAEARARWASEEGATLAARLAAAFEQLEARLAEALAPILEPFLAHGARVKALEQLHGTLGTLLGGAETRPIAVSGPADLVAALRNSFGDRPGVSFADAEAPDVTITLADTRIRSQLRAWARKLDSALGAPA